MAKEVKIIVASAAAGAAICACAAQMINRRATSTTPKGQLAPQTHIKSVATGSCNAPGCYNNHQDS